MSLPSEKLDKKYIYRDYSSWPEEDKIKVGIFEDLTINLKEVFK